MTQDRAREDGREARRRTGVQQRADEMCRMRAEGESLQVIGQRFGVTRERARQIIRDVGGPTLADVQAQREREREAERVRLGHDIRDFLHGVPGFTAEEVATALGISAAQVRWALGDDAGRLLVRPGVSREAATRAELVDDLRRAAALIEGPLTTGAYNEVRHQVGGRSVARLTQVFGYWSAACAAAGVHCGEARRGGYARAWTPDVMVDHARDYLLRPGSEGTFEGFTRRLRATPGAPSAMTVRNVLGSWSRIKTLALASAPGSAASRHLPAGGDAPDVDPGQLASAAAA